MAFTYGFYNSKGGDRKYNADQMGNLFDGILNDGVFDNVGNIFATVPGEGLQVLVKSGRAWFNKTWSYNDAAYPIYLERPDVAVPRIDAIVLEVDRRETHRRNRIGYIVGIPDSTPKKPTLTNSDLIHQHPLAYVTVRAGTESILHSDIEIRVGQSDCPFVTGILQTANIDDLFAAWNEQFTTWFEGVRSQLEGDVAANLLREIQLRLPIADKATSSEVGAGTVDNKYITPKQLAPHLGKIKDASTGQSVSVSLKNAYLRPYAYIRITPNDLPSAIGGRATSTSISFGYNNQLALIATNENGWYLVYLSTYGSSSVSITKKGDITNGTYIDTTTICRQYDTSNSSVIYVYIRSDSRYYAIDTRYEAIFDSGKYCADAILSDFIVFNINRYSLSIRPRNSTSSNSVSYPISMANYPKVLGGNNNTLKVIVNGGGTTYYVHNLHIIGSNSMTADANKITLTMNSEHSISSVYPQIGNFAFVTLGSSDKYLACPLCINCNNYSHNYSQARGSESVNESPYIVVGGTKVIAVSKYGSETLCYIIDFNSSSTTMQKIKYTGSVFDGVVSVDSAICYAITSLGLSNGDAVFINPYNSTAIIIDNDNLNMTILPCFLPRRTTNNSTNDYYTNIINYVNAQTSTTKAYGRVTLLTLDVFGANTSPVLTYNGNEHKEPNAAYSVKMEKVVTD